MTAADRRALAWLRRRRVAVLKGGWSSERAISLLSGRAVERALRRLGVKAEGIDVRPDVAERVARRKIRFCFLAVHGPFGEDGRLQAALDMIGVPYTGEGQQTSAAAMDKDVSKRLFRDAGVPTAPWALVEKTGRGEWSGLAAARSLARTGPAFVKPNDQGSAIGVSRVRGARALDAALRTAFRYSSRVMVERFVAGREMTVGILGDRALPVVEIVPEHAFYDFHSKYAKGGSRHLVPAPVSAAATRRLQAASLAAFRALDGRVYGRVDLILRPSGKPVVLEVNTIPGMTATSLLPDAARAAGLDFDRLVLRVAALSLAART